VVICASDATIAPVEVELRPATEADRERLRTIHHAAYHDLVERIFGPWQEDRQDRYFDAAWQRTPHDCVFVDGELAGFCSTRRADDEIEVDELVIAPQFQGRGVGSTLLRKVLDEALAKRVPVKLRTAHQNRADRLYERLGFVEVGTTETHRLYEWSPAHKSE
jgi:ribosomal protein S18 acetylase RimI-like enzyme